MSCLAYERSRAQCVRVLWFGVLSSAALLSTSEPASAQDLSWLFGSERREMRLARAAPERRFVSRRDREPVRKRETSVVRETSFVRETSALADTARKKKAVIGQPADALLAVISLSGQRMVVYDRSGPIAETKVSTGTATHRTPAGIYSIIQRNRFHRSNIYSGAPMPWMQRITWSGIAMHAGVVPGYPASHGCIRLTHDFAPKMWSLARIGVRVVVAPHDVTPVEISHSSLPAPAMASVPMAETGVALRLASVGGNAAVAEHRTIEPFAFSHIRRSMAAAALASAERARQPALDRAQQTSAIANEAAEKLRAARAQMALFEARAAALAAAPRAPAPAPAEQQSPSPLAAAKTELEIARAALADIRAAEMQASDAAFAAARAVHDGEAAIADASEAVKQAAWGNEPVSVLISRKEARIYLRQSFNPLHDEPIRITEPERPLGTHIFTAIEAKDGGAVLRWLAITLPSTPPEIAEAERNASRKKPGKPAAAPPPRPVLAASDAAGALDRIEIPEASRKLIAERLWAGASLIISDYAASNETGRGTDFIVQPR